MKMSMQCSQGHEVTGKKEDLQHIMTWFKGGLYLVNGTVICRLPTFKECDGLGIGT